jgi:hypothetical protein
VTLGEMGWMNAPRPYLDPQRPEKADRKAGEPEDRPDPTRDEARREDEQCAGKRDSSHLQQSSKKIGIGLPGQRKQADEGEQDDDEGDAEDQPVLAECLRDRKRADEHRRDGDQHHAEDEAVLGVDGVREPGVARPRPPERAQDQDAAADPAPRRILMEKRRHLGEPEDEDQVEEQLERCNPMLGLDEERAHASTLTLS